MVININVNEKQDRRIKKILGLENVLMNEKKYIIKVK